MTTVNLYMLMYIQHALNIHTCEGISVCDNGYIMYMYVLFLVTGPLRMITHYAVNSDCFPC